MIIQEYDLLLIGFLQLFFFILSAIAKSECDTIMFNPKKAWFQTIYWLSKKDVSKRSWLFKYPLSFLWDGWHLMDSTRNVCLILVMLIPYVILFSISWYYVVIGIVTLYVLYGIIFELFYQY